MKRLEDREDALRLPEIPNGKTGKGFNIDYAFPSAKSDVNTRANSKVDIDNEICFERTKEHRMLSSDKDNSNEKEISDNERFNGVEFAST